MNMSPETENHDEYTRSETVTVTVRECVHSGSKEKRMTGGFRIKVPVASPENDEVSGESVNRVYMSRSNSKVHIVFQMSFFLSVVRTSGREKDIW